MGTDYIRVNCNLNLEWRDFVLNLIPQHGHVSVAHTMKTEHT